MLQHYVRHVAINWMPCHTYMSALYFRKRKWFLKVLYSQILSIVPLCGISALLFSLPFSWIFCSKLLCFKLFRVSFLKFSEEQPFEVASLLWKLEQNKTIFKKQAVIEKLMITNKKQKVSNASNIQDFSIKR